MKDMKLNCNNCNKTIDFNKHRLCKECQESLIQEFLERGGVING